MFNQGLFQLKSWKLNFRFLLIFGSLYVGAFSFDSNASIPDLKTDAKFRNSVSQALSEQASSFDYKNADTTQTYIIEYGEGYFRTLESKSNSSLYKLLSKNSTFGIEETREVEGNLIHKYKVTFSSGPRVQKFLFNLVLLDQMDLDQTEAYQVAPRNKLKVQVAVVNLMRRFNESESITSLLERIGQANAELEKLNKSGESKAMQSHEIRQRAFRVGLVDRLLSLTSPMKKIEYIKNHIVPRAFAEISDRYLLRILQERELVGPALEALNLSHEDHEERIDFSDEAVQYCYSLGGIVELYQAGTNDAYLCRIGKAGVGVYTLYHFKNHQKVEGIEAFLNHVRYEASDQSQFAIVPEQGQARSRGVPALTIEAVKTDSKKVPAMSVVLPPSYKLSEYCRQRGGKPTRLESKTEGTDFKACVFKDFSGIDANTLFAGPEAEENRALTQVLLKIRSTDESMKDVNKK